MANIAPGEKFTIGYGNGKELEVVALNGNGQRKLSNAIAEMAGLEGEGGLAAFKLFDLAYDAVVICVGTEKADELFDTDVDAELGMEIASKVLGKQSLSEEERKKSE